MLQISRVQTPRVCMMLPQILNSKWKDQRFCGCGAQSRTFSVTWMFTGNASSQVSAKCLPPQDFMVQACGHQRWPAAGQGDAPRMSFGNISYRAGSEGSVYSVSKQDLYGNEAQLSWSTEGSPTSGHPASVPMTLH